MRITIRHKLHENIERLSLFWGYKTAGIFQNETEVKSYTNEHGESLQPNAKVMK